MKNVHFTKEVFMYSIFCLMLYCTNSLCNYILNNLHCLKAFVETNIASKSYVLNCIASFQVT